MSEAEVLRSERDGAVLTLTMNRPEALNALDAQLVTALRRAIDAAGRDAQVRAIVVRGEGRGFSAGGDIKEMAAGAETGNADLGNALRQVYHPLIRALRRCPQPVIAAINGVAAGAGLGLAMACDLRLCAATARLNLAFVRIGLVPDAGSLFFLTRLVGLGRALELALEGATIDASTAERIGLVNAVVPDAELFESAHARAAAFGERSAEAVALTKRGLERALSLDLEQALELEAQLQSMAGRTPAHREAIRAFVEKRLSRA
jgi:2-(1,2-epoxy-1,2-dihydrophenyl)acetyl-CoA isomerase